VLHLLEAKGERRHTMSNTPSKAEIEALVKRHGATSYRNRADTQYPAYGFTEDGLNGLIDEVLAKWGTPQPVVREPQCWCLTCRPMRVDDPESIRMALCPTCGNKRCPKANDHRNQCSNSNEPGQKGSAYEGCGITQQGGSNAE
jgi:hypothetical protein